GERNGRGDSGQPARRRRRHPPRPRWLARTTARKRRIKPARSGPPALRPGWKTAPGCRALRAASAATRPGFPRQSRAPATLAPSRYTKYLSIRIPSLVRVASGTWARSVRIAWASADPHWHARPVGIAATAAATTLLAFSAFLTRLAMMSVTVTA